MSELRTLLETYGFVLDRVKGSHYSFIIEVSGQRQLLVVPFRHPLQPVYVKKALAIIEQLKTPTSEDEDIDDDQDS